MFVNPENFAFAVVSSSDKELSIQDKLNLYKSAYTIAVENNKSSTEKSKDKTEANLKKKTEILRKLR
ncbi:hypothetical protein [Facklamia hominis]|uniref:Uncharacterized protein n=1 Tax=Facklamia hominis TaxID=178214 RepID=A0AAJ1Q729_9LACT|nr:hypothetical protein [Facklamia hominis]MDK7187964.1 hypothetical protein [Facklamia hominis]